MYHTRQNVLIAFLLNSLMIQVQRVDGRAALACIVPSASLAFSKVNEFYIELVLVSCTDFAISLTHVYCCHSTSASVFVSGLTSLKLTLASFCMWDVISDFL